MTLEKAVVSIAGQAGTFGPYTYHKGFYVEAVIKMIDCTFGVNVNCELSSLTNLCDFHLHVNVDFNQFLNQLKKVVHLTLIEKYPELASNGTSTYNLWSLKEVGMSKVKKSKLL